MAQVLLLFVDGVGLGLSDIAVNPFMRAELPTLHRLLGNGSLTQSAAPRHASRASMVAVDAVLGFEGTPQSGTGQTALLTGANGVELHGRHFGPWVPSRLRTLVRDESLLARATNAGYRVAFANAYPEEVLQLIAGVPTVLGADAPDSRTGPRDAHAAADAPGTSDVRRAGSVRGARDTAGARIPRVPSFLRAGPPLAAIGAGLLTRHTPELERGDAVASEITNEGWRERLGRKGVPSIDAVRAGRNLARIAGQHDVTLFAHYATDYAGHQRDMGAAVLALEKLDAFLAGLIDEADDALLIFVVSDHGNIEDVRTGHTRNPALGIVIGNGHALLARRLESLTDVTPTILDALSL